MVRRVMEEVNSKLIKLTEFGRLKTISHFHTSRIVATVPLAAVPHCTAMAFVVELLVLELVGISLGLESKALSSVCALFQRDSCVRIIIQCPRLPALFHINMHFEG